MSLTSHADLAADTAARADPDVAGRYHVVLPNHWDYLLPSGGVVMTAALRAAEVHLADPALRLVSATTIFASPIHPGALVADVHVIRRGHATAQVRVIMRHQQEKTGEPGLELVATFMRERTGPDVVAAAFPSWVKALGEALPVDDGASNNPHARFRFYHQLECKLADGAAFWGTDFTEGPARYARWLRYRVPQRDRQGNFDRLALAPLVDTMPTALHRAIGPGTRSESGSLHDRPGTRSESGSLHDRPGPYRFYAPSLDLTVYPVDDTTREWLLIAVTLRRARAGYAIADAEVWDDEGRLVAVAAQAMYLQSATGEPPKIDASRRT